ncbi:MULTISPECIES: CaiB/BaiF CoA transferase family protein [unclassified Sphingomonas]|uniref:CaiB/BaiF CoA transferase family protein n=1 Tax=unclassified Sphingomonas TaxID=196159 RepID=UPI0006FFF05B|nr:MULTISPECIES: CoA transferase [unclassified Sphingomonas]KQX25985.1 carnitine dehydratase [Sphingomonas sp. Root1294]KQY69050.1 carnitine dehydratase [Sphingomonas sp. Root50]KRB89305.1 carnitine dehydratase [Sphingomonas sp. Root720]
MSDSEAPPLQGVRVIEFCQIAAGPFAGMLLADQGADVIKVEPAAGDAMRGWPPLNNGYSENFASLNRNKRSIVLDLKDPADAEVARRLILDADVVIENSRPGVMKRLGLDYERFASERPDLVYCSLSAFGQTGPRSRDGGFDVTVQAASGIMSVTGEPGAPPVKAGVPISDFATGLYASMAISMLLYRVKSGGPGGYIDVSMLGCSLAIAALQTSEYFGTGKAPGRWGSAHPRNAPYKAFRCADGYIVLAAGNQNLWSLVCDVIERRELLDDPRFASVTLRAANQDALSVEMEAVLQKGGIAHWLAAFRAVGVPCEPINDYASALSAPEVREMGWVAPITLPGGRDTETVGNVVRINGSLGAAPGSPPDLGEHGEAIRAALDTERAGEPA